MASQKDSTQLPTCDHHKDGFCEHWETFVNKARKHLSLGYAFVDYWRFRREGPASDVSRAYTELLAVAVEIFAFLNSYQDKEGFYEGTPQDPKVFWRVAQPPAEVADDHGPGIVETYVWMITHDDFFLSPPSFIDHILWTWGALFALGEHCLTGHGASGDDLAASVLIVHTKEIFKHFWENRHCIEIRPQCARDAEGYGDDSVEPMHDMVGKFPEPFSRLFESYSYLYDYYLEHLETCTPEKRAAAPKYPKYRDTYLPFVGLHVWVSGNAQLIGTSKKDMTILPFATMLQDSDGEGDKTEVDRIISEAVLNGVGADAFFTQFKKAMQQLHDDDLYGYTEIAYVHSATILAVKEAIFPSLAHHDILQPIVRLLNYQARAKSPHRVPIWTFVSSLFDAYTKRFIELCRGPEVKSSKPLVRGEDILDYMARGVDILCESDPLSAASQQHYLVKCVSAYSTVIELAAKSDAVHAQVKSMIDGMRARASSQWWSGLQRLRSMQRRGLPCSELIRSWTKFGVALGVNLVAEERRIRGRDIKLYCSLSRCEHHTEKPRDSIPLKTCKGCGEVMYCSRLCQTRHWKEEHKKKCGDRLPAVVS